MSVGRKSRFGKHRSSRILSNDVWETPPILDAGLRQRALTRELLEAFFGDRRQAGYKSHLTPRSLRPILEYLEAEGVVSIPEVLVKRSTVDELLD